MAVLPNPDEQQFTPPPVDYNNAGNQGVTYLNPDGTITSKPEANTTVGQVATPSTALTGTSGFVPPGNVSGSSPVSSPTGTAPAAGATGGASLFGITLPGLGFLTEWFITAETILTDLMQPSFWFRIGAFLAGIPILLIGLWCLIKAADNAPLAPHMPSVVPVPV